MKILYGVQGTGNGHITRARHLVDVLNKDPEIEVDYLFSGRNAQAYFDMACFGDYATKRGVTFSTEKGRIDYTKTLIENNIAEVVKDIRSLDVKKYDLVLNDFEPISAWSAKLQGIPSISISHQSAFLHPVPKKNDNLFTSRVTKYFAPFTYCLGTHWYHFGHSIIPPFVSPELTSVTSAANFKRNAESFLVYLPFEDPEVITEHLEPLSEYHFICFHPSIISAKKVDNLSWYPLSISKFRQSLISSAGVICNAGFELATECLTLGKPMLLKPLQGQYEQSSNAYTLETLGLCNVLHEINSEDIQDWIPSRKNTKIVYPSNCQALLKWIKAGKWHDPSSLCKELWDSVIFPENFNNQLDRFYS